MKGGNGASWEGREPKPIHLLPKGGFRSNSIKIFCTFCGVKCFRIQLLVGSVNPRASISSINVQDPNFRFKMSGI